MYNIKYTKDAKINLIDIFKYISNDNTFYAAKVINSIKNTINILKLFPFSGKNIDNNMSMIVESKFKYKIVYTVIESNIYIISIFKYRNLWE